MSKNKNREKNQYGTFHIGGIGYKKNIKLLITTFIVVIFLLATIFIIFQNLHHPVKVAETKQDLSQIPGWWYQKYFGSSVCTPASSNWNVCRPDADPDHDGLTNLQEFYYHTDPLNAHTVKDKLNDGQLVAAGFDPSRPGRMTFDQVTSPDNILGESLLVQKDLQDLINESKDISKIPLPLVAESDLKTTSKTDDATYQTYLSDLQNKIAKYFSQDDLNNIAVALKSASDSDLVDMNKKADLVSEELKIITVPQKLVTYHQYIIAFFQLIPKVLLNKSDPNFNSDQWYQDSQSLFAVSQKLSLLSQILSQRPN